MTSRLNKICSAALAFFIAAAAVCSQACAAGPEVIGTVNNAPASFLYETPYLAQCELGSVVSDAIRSETGADVALVPMSVIANDLNQGDVTMAEIENVFSADEAIVIREAHPAELYSLLETAVSAPQVDPDTETLAEGSEIDGRFCQVSGISFCYDVSAPIGERVVWIRTGDGAELDRADTTSALTVAAPVSLLSGTDSGETLCSVLAGYVASHSELPEGEQVRIRMIGARKNTIAGAIPRTGLNVGIAILIIAALFFGLKKRRAEDKNEIETHGNQKGELYGIYYSK